jgi:hypothetical protein
MSGHKAVRGPDLDWIGVLFQLRVAERSILMTINEKIAKEILAESQELLKKSMVPFKRLRSLAGRLSWAAGVVPRTRWTVNILYAVLRVHAEDLASGTESQRRAHRTDKRPKDFLIPTKRVELALLWTAKFWNTMGTAFSRVVPLEVTVAAEAPVFDASPWGLGGVLYNDAGEVLEYFASPVTEAEDCAALGIRVGDAAAQATLEALAILVGLRLWETRFRGRRLQLPLKSDSTAALALAGKLASASPAFNHLGAEISLQCEKMGLDGLTPSHIAGELNVVADALSRLQAPSPKALPEECRSAQRLEAPRRPDSWYRLPTASRRPDLWGEKKGLAAWEAINGFE